MDTTTMLYSIILIVLFIMFFMIYSIAKIITKTIKNKEKG